MKSNGRKQKNDESSAPSESMEVRCNTFSLMELKTHTGVNSIINFLQFQKGRVQRNEITGATLGNFVKSIKLFCEKSDITIPWKKITRGLPKMRRHADDRAPTIEEIQKYVIILTGG